MTAKPDEQLELSYFAEAPTEESKLVGAAARQLELRRALGGHEWMPASRLMFIARAARDYETLGLSDHGSYVETLGISRGHGSRLFIIGAFWWSGHPFGETLAETYERARKWRETV